MQFHLIRYLICFSKPNWSGHIWPWPLTLRTTVWHLSLLSKIDGSSQGLCFPWTHGLMLCQLRWVAWMHSWLCWIDCELILCWCRWAISVCAFHWKSTSHWRASCLHKAFAIQVTCIDSTSWHMFYTELGRYVHLFICGMHSWQGCVIIEALYAELREQLQRTAVLSVKKNINLYSASSSTSPLKRSDIGHQSAASEAQDGESSPAKDRHSATVPCNQPVPCTQFCDVAT